MKSTGEDRESLNSVYLKHAFNYGCRNCSLPPGTEITEVPTPTVVQVGITGPGPSLVLKDPDLHLAFPETALALRIVLGVVSLRLCTTVQDTDL